MRRMTRVPCVDRVRLVPPALDAHIVNERGGGVFHYVLVILTVFLTVGEYLFLCGETPESLSEKLGVKIRFTENDGADFLFSLLGE